MGGEFTYQNGINQNGFDNHSHMSNERCEFQKTDAKFRQTKFGKHVDTIQKTQGRNSDKHQRKIQRTLQNPLIRKCLLELSWQISAREMVKSNTCKCTDCGAELWLCTLFGFAPELRKIAPSSGKLRSSCGFVFSRALHQASRSRQPQ